MGLGLLLGLGGCGLKVGGLSGGLVVLSVGLKFEKRVVSLGLSG